MLLAEHPQRQPCTGAWGGNRARPGIRHAATSAPIAVVVATLFASIPPLNAAAQAQATAPDAPANGRCTLFDLDFSPGAVARGARGTVICRPDGTWAATTDQASGCIYATKIYTAGALVPAGDAENTVLECLSDGSWSPRPKASSAK